MPARVNDSSLKTLLESVLNALGGYGAAPESLSGPLVPLEVAVSALRTAHQAVLNFSGSKSAEFLAFRSRLDSLSAAVAERAWDIAQRARVQLRPLSEPPDSHFIHELSSGNLLSNSDRERRTLLACALDGLACDLVAAVDKLPRPNSAQQVNLLELSVDLAKSVFSEPLGTGPLMPVQRIEVGLGAGHESPALAIESDSAPTRLTSRVRISCESCTASRKRCVAAADPSAACLRCQRLEIACERKLAKRSGPAPKAKPSKKVDRRFKTPEAFKSVPRSPVRTTGLPDSETIKAVAALYFPVSETAMPLLHPTTWFRNEQRTALFTASFLLTMIYDDPLAPSVVSYKSMEWQIAEVARRELLAFLSVLDRGVQVTTEPLAAVANLAGWCLYRSLFNLARRVLDLMGALLLHAGYVADLETLDDPLGPHTFHDVAVQRFSPHLYDRPLNLEELQELQRMWILYWERRRIAASRLVYLVMERDWGRLVNVAPYPTTLFRKPHLTTPKLWLQSASDPLFDPRAAIEEVEIGSTVAFELPKGHPDRLHAMQGLEWRVMNLGSHVPWLRIELRNRVYCFLARCRAIGLASPAMVPDHIEPGMSIQLIELVEERNYLGDLIGDLFVSFPKQVRDVVAGRSPIELLQLVTSGCGSELFAMNTVPFIFMIPLLRLDLRSRLGILVGSEPVELVNGLDDLAAEFARPEYAELLEVAITFTKLCRDVLILGPMPFFHCYVIYCDLFSVFVLHLAVFKRIVGNIPRSDVAGALSAPDDNIMTDIQAALIEVQGYLDICIQVLGTVGIHLGTKNKMPDLQELAWKLYNDDQITASQLESTKFRDDGVVGVGALDGLQTVLDAYLQRR